MVPSLFLLALLKCIVDMAPELLENAYTFPSSGVIFQGCLFNVQREKRVKGILQAQFAKERRTARGNRVPETEINRQV
ncbi:hypothetical protein DFO73_103351 [Cytobacillus oceanisediminis]|jgi:hypothetical protein|uniref:Uncharacterized protein n=1 Tax=Cytobacillus oceanisediminis TaxID=665099 RepID=A0A2V3AAE9_9BACI|nr:hypothetical protein DFO73_103351 [Cytobacillus oceanisediminis]